jgi:CheY-like chemotaxis protein
MNFNNRVLVIDDDEMILDVYRSILVKQPEKTSSTILASLMNSDDKIVQDKRHFQLEIANQGKKGLDMVKQALEDENPYAVVFIDMRMPPGWDGVRTAKEIRKIDALTQIVIVTAYSDASVTSIVEQVGFTDRLLYLKKPFDSEEILQLSDSLSMRWNLETKVKGLALLLEELIDNLMLMNIAFNNETEVQPFLEKTINSISKFLETPDIFLACIEHQDLMMKVGLGIFATGLVDGPEFQEIIRQIIAKEPITKMFRIDNYVIMLFSCHEYQGVVVGALSDKEVEGFDRLLEVLAIDLAKMFKTGETIADMRRQLNSHEAKFKMLEKKLVEAKAKQS